MCILIVSAILRITSHVEHTKECNGIDSENKSVKRNADHQNCLAVCFFLHVTVIQPYIKKMFLA